MKDDETHRYDLMVEAFSEIQTEIKSARLPKPMPVHPPLSQVLAGLGPLPTEALFLGMAYDELPVLLNLHDPLPGPLLVAGDAGTGKTALLQTIALAAEQMHSAERLQFGILTSHPDEWSGFERIANNVGVFSIHHRSAEDFILSLAAWAHGNKSSKQSILLLLDDLEAVSNMDMEAVQNLRWLLLRGPARRVWSLITLSTQRLDAMTPWLGAFRTRIIGRVQNAEHIRKLGAEGAGLRTLSAGAEFTLREGNRWLKFWIPSQG
ncbi:MAG: NACHT domain-containing protein [Chloroflexota bacterium]|nr:NACHT domain-containing protein [Chloroflexota bacterium]MBI5704935.1 NACHT domain-containing protein [Chloroflexota bacterium]